MNLPALPGLLRTRLAVAAGGLLFSACERQAPKIEVPIIPPQTREFAPPRGYPVVARLMIRIDQHGKCRITEDDHEPEPDLRQAMAQARAKAPTSEVCIYADRRVPFERVTSVMLMAHDAGYRGVSVILGWESDPPGGQGAEDELKLNFAYPPDPPHTP